MERYSWVTCVYLIWVVSIWGHRTTWRSQFSPQYGVQELNTRPQTQWQVLSPAVGPVLSLMCFWLSEWLDTHHMFGDILSSSQAFPWPSHFRIALLSPITRKLTSILWFYTILLVLNFISSHPWTSPLDHSGVTFKPAILGTAHFCSLCMYLNCASHLLYLYVQQIVICWYCVTRCFSLTRVRHLFILTFYMIPYNT